MNYSKWTINDLLKELNRYDKKLNTIKTNGGLWAIGGAIRSIRAELDKRISDPNEVNRLLREFKNA